MRSSLTSAEAAGLPLVSVLVPLYNHAPFIWRCLDSVLDDGYPHIELLVLDDGSTDDSLLVARQWADANAGKLAAFALSQQENQGISRTRNRLVRAARGAFIVNLASDDFLLPGGIAARLDFLHAHPGYLAVFGDALLVDANGRQLAQSCLRRLGHANPRALQRPDLLVDELILRWSLPGSIPALASAVTTNPS
jgi:glycosyltransferase involved in cell wall biosynthesis